MRFFKRIYFSALGVTYKGELVSVDHDKLRDEICFIANNKRDEVLEEATVAIKTLYQAMSFITLKAPGYDWNADPLFLTLKQGDANKLAEDWLKKYGGEE